MRVPFVGAALKFFAEMYNDINEYHYKIGKYGLKPEFCGKHHCAPFKVVCKNSLYEVRSYGNLTLATFTVNGSDYLNNGVKTGLAEILKYLNGNNDRDATIPYSVPLVVNGPLSTSTCPRAQLLKLINGGPGPTLSVALIPPYDTNPPIPTCPSLKIKYVTNGFCYVRMFSGYALPGTFISKGNEFIKILQNNEQFITHKPMIAVYNRPSQFTNRHNEIFIPVNKPVQGDRYC
ncbi:heme-binding protein 1-like [Gordionus sp. m RMFG-2023]|uniref:heme-binding protein 1-like n=1 Tax=Gordionus sp. m RMFG-2023 TaxID=3053472 RepID=UPI0031FD9568